MDGYESQLPSREMDPASHQCKEREYIQADDGLTTVVCRDCRRILDFVDLVNPQVKRKKMVVRA